MAQSKIDCCLILKQSPHIICFGCNKYFLYNSSFSLAYTSDKAFIDFANKNMEGGKITNVAFVLNDVHKSNFGYGNKYGYGYHADEKKWWQKIFS